MKLELYSSKNDLLELEIHDVKPKVTIGEIFFNECYHPWYPSWENLCITEFKEDFETVKTKIIEFYKKETENSKIDGIVKRVPGHANLISGQKILELQNCKVADCKIRHKETMCLTLAFDGLKYKNSLDKPEI